MVPRGSEAKSLVSSPSRAEASVCPNLPPHPPPKWLEHSRCLSCWTEVQQKDLGASQVAQWSWIRLPMQKTPVWSLGWDKPLEKGVATFTSILAWRIPWIEEGYRPWGHKEPHTAEVTEHTQEDLQPTQGCLALNLMLSSRTPSSPFSRNREPPVWDLPCLSSQPGKHVQSSGDGSLLIHVSRYIPWPRLWPRGGCRWSG